MARKKADCPPNQSSSKQQAGACGGDGGSSVNSGSGGGGGGLSKALVAPGTGGGPIYPSIKQQLAILGLALREIPGDGNCLFGALADQMDGARGTHNKHRQQIVGYMRQHRHHFEPFVEDDVSFHEHLRRLSEVGTFGGNECIVAFARLHNVMVVIHQLNTPLWTISGNDDSSSNSGVGVGGGALTSEVHISYHNGDHYNSVRKLGDCTTDATHIRITSSMAIKAADLEPITENEHRLMQCTGCDDAALTRRMLEENNHQFDSTCEALIMYVLDQNNHHHHQQHQNDRMSELWARDGTGSRILGDDAAAAAVAAAHSVADADQQQLEQQQQPHGHHMHRPPIKRKMIKKTRKQQSNERKKQQHQHQQHQQYQPHQQQYQQQQQPSDASNDLLKNYGVKDYEDDDDSVVVVKDMHCLSI